MLDKWWCRMTAPPLGGQVVPSADGEEFLMVYDALSMNATCRCPGRICH